MYSIPDKHLVLRLPTTEDANDLCEAKNNREAANLLEGNNKGYTVADIQNWIAYHNEKSSNHILAIEDALKNKVIGHVGLYDIDKFVGTAEFGILIGLPEYWGGGLGTAATRKILEIGFQEMELNRISLHVLSDNSRAIAVYAKLGFVVEGELRAAARKGDELKNVTIMSVLNKEFKS